MTSETSPDTALLGVTNELVGLLTPTVDLVEIGVSNESVGVLEAVTETVAISVESPEVISLVIDNSSKSGTTYLASYGDASPAIVFDVPADQAVDKVDIEVLEEWDGVGATILLGTLAAPDLFFGITPVQEVELTSLAMFSKDFQVLGPVQVLLTIVPGTTPTKGTVRIQITTTPQGN